MLAAEGGHAGFVLFLRGHFGEGFGRRLLSRNGA